MERCVKCGRKLKSSEEGTCEICDREDDGEDFSAFPGPKEDSFGGVF